MLEFKFFPDNKSFTKWQEENPNAKIYQMSPVANALQMNLKSKNFSGGITFGLFVIYDLDIQPWTI